MHLLKILIVIGVVGVAVALALGFGGDITGYSIKENLSDSFSDFSKENYFSKQIFSFVHECRNIHITLSPSPVRQPS